MEHAIMVVKKQFKGFSSADADIAILDAIWGAFSGARIGLCFHQWCEICCKVVFRQTLSTGLELDQVKMSSFGGYLPLMNSFLSGRGWEQARNFAVVNGANLGISCVMKTLRGGKQDVDTSMVAAFGSGVMISLVTGVRGPAVLSVGVVFALARVGMFKVEEYSLRNPKYKTRQMFPSTGIGLNHYAITKRKEEKKGGTKRWF